jgi:hypothetical protein
MRVILKPAGLFLFGGSMVIMTVLTVLRSQGHKLQEMPETPPIPGLQLKTNHVSIYDDQTKMPPANLTEVGKVDWVHWGTNAQRPDGRKRDGNAISALTLVAPQATLMPEGDRGPTRGILWSDSGSGKEKTPVTYDALHVGTQNGFRFSVTPHDTKPHTLYVYCGGFKAEGTFDARMSDGSNVKIDRQEDAALPNHYYTRVFTVAFQPSKPDRSLSVEWKMGGGGGNISLQAAALE